MAGRRNLWRLVGGALLVGGAVVVARFGGSSASPERPYEPPSRLAEPAPLCPWREPDADQALFFPEANRREAVTLILSGRRLDLARELGRQPSADENALRLYRILHDRDLLGTILVRRVKGEHGAIEIVVAVNPEGAMRGVKLQRHREPAELAAALSGAQWLHRFNERTTAGPWPTGDDLRDLPAAAQRSAGAIVEGMHSLLVLLAVAEGPSRPNNHPLRN